ncbi:hypothetical protein RKLH11_1324 [Rhodobacteraceae bacterium KLH11]|nr:hypothetical protein RKLH11_1324 [Rhodobacteraceae bacterium KLH11]
MKYLLSPLFVGTLFLSFVFVIIKVSAFVFMNGLQPQYFILPALLVIAAIFVGKLEGVQQASNSIQALDKDVYTEIASSKKWVQTYERIKKHYDDLSTARQLVSILAILSFKEILTSFDHGLQEFTVWCTNFNSDWISVPTLIKQHCDRVEYTLLNGTANFVASAAIIAWALQLLPKKVARFDPVRHLKGLNLILVRVLLWGGKSGIGHPVDLMMWFYRLINRKLPSSQVRFPPSKSGVLDALAKKRGYSIEKMIVRLRFFEERVVLKEEITFRYHRSHYRKDTEANELVYITDIANSYGGWSDLDQRSCEIESRFHYSSEVESAFLAEQRSSSFSKAKEKDSSKFYTKFSFSDILKSKDSDELDVVCSSEYLFTKKDFSDLSVDHSIEFTLTMPIRKLIVYLETSLPDRNFTGPKLVVKDPFSHEKSVEMHFSDTANPGNDVRISRVIEREFPPLGADVEVKTKFS